MATTITLLKNFAGGQGAGFSNYYSYASDHDYNYTLIENAVNQLVSESLAVSGPNASLVLDLFGVDDAGGLGPITSGVLGEHSYRVSIGAPTSEVDVEGGAAVAGGVRIGYSTPVSIVGSGASGDRYVYLDGNGFPGVATGPGAGVLDIVKIQWNGSAFTTPIEQLAEIFIDGDDWAYLRRREEAGDATTPTFEALDAAGTPFRNAFRNVANRIRDLELILAGESAGTEESTTLGALILKGTVSAPGLATRIGSTFYLGTGFYPPAANQIGVAINSSQLLRFVAGQILANADGAVGTPFYGWGTDAGLGMYRIANDRLGFASNSILGLELSDYQQPTSPTAFRFHVRTATAHSHAGAGIEAISFDTEDLDVGAWGAAPTATWTVPTGGAGFYAIIGFAHFDESSAGGGGSAYAGNVRSSQLYILSTTTVVAEEENGPAAATDTKHSLATLVQLAAGATIQLRATQDCGGTMDVYSRLAAVRLW